MQKIRVGAWALCALSLGLSAGVALAAPPAAPSSEAVRKDEARKHFEAGRDLDTKGDVVGAVREFTASRALFKTRGNTLNLALGLRKLGRIGEALDLLEAYLKDFENTTPEDKAMVEGEISATNQLVGTLEIDTSTAAQIVVDGVVRGKTPLDKPLRLSAGTHVVRLSPESFAARRVDTVVTIVAQQSTQLKPTFEELEEHGGLNIKAASGGAFDVYIDGELVGVTPLALQLPPRDYSIALRGPDDTGSLPARSTVDAGRVQDLSIATIKLDAKVDVQVDPPDATLFLDDVAVGPRRLARPRHEGPARLPRRGPGLRAPHPARHARRRRTNVAAPTETRRQRLRQRARGQPERPRRVRRARSRALSRSRGRR